MMEIDLRFNQKFPRYIDIVYMAPSEQDINIFSITNKFNPMRSRINVHSIRSSYMRGLCTIFKKQINKYQFISKKHWMSRTIILQ
jgi:hypothetical protein